MPRSSSFLRPAAFLAAVLGIAVGGAGAAAPAAAGRPAGRQAATADPPDEAVSPAAGGTERSPAETPRSDAETAARLVREGNEARRRGRIAVALGSWRRAALLAPARYEIRILIADTLRRSGRGAEAVPEFEAARALDPSRFEAHAGLALVRRAAWDHDGAAALLLAALGEVTPAGKPDLLLTLAETRRRQGRAAEAEELFREVLRRRPGDAGARAGLARVAEDRGDPARAAAEWALHLDARPDDASAARRRDEMLVLAASIDAVAAAARTSPDAAIFTELGRLRAVAGDAAGAAAAYRGALARDARHAGARRGLAAALSDIGDRRGARAEYRRVLALDRSDAVALYTLAATESGPGGTIDPAAAAAAWRRVVEARPADLFATRAWIFYLEQAGPEALRQAAATRNGPRPAPGRGRAAPDDGASTPRLAALLAGAAGDWDGAAEFLAAALRRDPTDPWTIEAAGDLLWQRPDLLARLDARAQAEAADGRDAAAHLLVFARLETWRGRPRAALALARRAAAIDPRSPVAASLLSETLENAGDADAALAEARRAAALPGARPADRIDLALALLRSGRHEEAAAAVRRVLPPAAPPGPHTAPAFSIVGAALSAGGDMEGAAEAYAAALRADPADSFGLARGQHPVALAALGRHVEARRALLGDVPEVPDLMYREAWRFARDRFHDRRLNGQDWMAWRDRDRGALATPGDACRAIAAMLASLGDRWTRLRDPEETAAAYLAPRGGVLATDALGRVAPGSATVVARDLPEGLGYVRVGNLSDPRVVAEIRAALEAMRHRTGIILDLRGNPGGYSRQADAVADLLIGPGAEVGADVGPDGAARPRTTGGEGAVTDAPLTVLVDGQTASAAERLARDLEIAGRGVVRGDRTRGKGMAQASRVLPGGATVLVSVGSMLDAGGAPLDGRGLAPAEPAPPEEQP